METKITFLGDIMCDNKMAESLELYKNCQTGKYDFSDCFRHVVDSFEASDYVLANLETPISEDNSRLTKALWTFTSPIEFAEAIKESGIDFVSTANNHCLDGGTEGIRSTIKSLNSIGLAHCGIQINNQNSCYIARIGPYRIGILSYTYGTNAFSNGCYLSRKNLMSVNLLQEQEGWIHNHINRILHGRGMRFVKRLELILFPDNEGKNIYEKETVDFYRKYLIKKDIRRIRKKKVDLVIAYLHIGGQYNTVPSNYTKKTTEWFLNHGCDIVVDNHEHVIHGLKFEEKKLAAYALGNFLGSAGVTEPPYDRYCNYSIGLHVYLETEQAEIAKIAFSVYKTIITREGKMEVWPAIELLELQITEKEKNLLKKDILEVAFVFSGIRYYDVAEEFMIYKGL